MDQLLEFLMLLKLRHQRTNQQLLRLKLFQLTNNKQSAF
ncbi:hypothetical protein KM1_143330 [Entamoeba histolytica HM-3:IMSS]|uniref:Uncharacterized protein n=1 Tax=Entamoeba histolytica HM-3:IMSS TaxID=885315 RepID=M7X4I4_ENTHI|nr:hypothetical protein KM1_143330 [Entamoeba histolytica HM-3:IMSS]